MARVRTQFVCRECGSVHPKWMGKCPDCGAWDALDEFKPADKSAGSDPHRSIAGITDREGGPRGAVPITQVSTQTDPMRRTSTRIGELDRVLGGVGVDGTGGGIVPGSAILLGGDPGIGKSTLMLQAAALLAHDGQRVLYVTSEESIQQVRLRAARLGGDGDAGDAERDLPDELYVLADTNLARIVEQARKLSPAVVIVDSIQMIYKGDLAAAPGTVSQLRACCLELVYFAKLSGSAMFLIGHVTKEGALAGPRLLEHMVDAVLYFEGDRYHSHRIVRGIKNRFGATLEVGLFEMTDRGLLEVPGGASLLAAEYQARSGSVVCPVLQGSRCLLVELQALTAAGFLGSAKRKVSGIDRNRLDVLIAVLERRVGLRLADQDVFASSVGGVRIAEPAADLALALAIASAHHDRSLPAGTCVIGEVGLGGEVRHVQGLDRRITEAARLGFTHLISPPLTPPKAARPKGVKLTEARSLDDAVQVLM